MFVLCRFWRRATDDERIDHGRVTPPPLVANHDGGGIDNPDAMGGIAYGCIDWKETGGDKLENIFRLPNN